MRKFTRDQPRPGQLFRPSFRSHHQALGNHSDIHQKDKRQKVPQLKAACSLPVVCWVQSIDWYCDASTSFKWYKSHETSRTATSFTDRHIGRGNSRWHLGLTHSRHDTSRLTGPNTLLANNKQFFYWGSLLAPGTINEKLHSRPAKTWVAVSTLNGSHQ